LFLKPGGGERKEGTADGLLPDGKRGKRPSRFLFARKKKKRKKEKEA